MWFRKLEPKARLARAYLVKGLEESALIENDLSIDTLLHKFSDRSMAKII